MGRNGIVFSLCCGSCFTTVCLSVSLVGYATRRLIGFLVTMYARPFVLYYCPLLQRVDSGLI